MISTEIATSVVDAIFNDLVKRYPIVKTMLDKKKQDEIRAAWSKIVQSEGK